jgi:hypothetical protein
MPSSSTGTTELGAPELQLLRVFVERLERLRLRYMVTGSVASMLYGEPRMTHDVDLVLALRDDAEAERLCAGFPDAEFYCPPLEVVRVEARRAQRGHFNIIHHDTGMKADVYMAGDDALHRWALDNVRMVSIGGLNAPLAPPEYVVLRKLEYFREGGSDKHLRDIRAMLRVLPAEDWDRENLQTMLSKRRLEDEWARVALPETGDTEPS